MVTLTTGVSWEREIRPASEINFTRDDLGGGERCGCPVFRKHEEMEQLVSI
jgi:hypothetical protein